MALHLNLNHELEKVRAQRRRDPVKLAIIGLIFVVGLFVAQYMWTMTKSTMAVHERDRKRNEFAQKDPLAKAAVTEEAELQKKLGSSERFQARLEGRFYWAPLMQVVIENIPGNVHITRFSGDVNPDDSSKVQFKLEGIVAGTEPRSKAEDFRQRLSQALEKKYRNVNATYRGDLQEGTDTVSIDGKAVPTATFAIHVQLQHRESTATKKP